MSARNKILASAGVLALAASLGLGAGTAQASSAGCAFSNGCATLHGFDAANHAIAMDAKYQNPKEIVIGYPDIAGDGATNFDAVLHYTKGQHTVTYQDSGITPLGHTLHPVGAISGNGAPIAFTATGATSWQASGLPTGVSFNSTTRLFSAVSAPSATNIPVTVTASDVGGDTSIVAGLLTASGSSVSFAASDNDSLVLNGGPTFAPGGLQFASTVTASPADPAETTATSYKISDPCFSISDAGLLSATASTCAGGTFSSLTVTATDADGAVATETLGLKVSAVKSVNPGNDVPFYTFVYAKGGVWSNQCVTDVNGSGALKLEACTLGRDRYQDFFALDGTGSKSASLQNSTAAFRIQDWLASVANPADSCLTDPSSLNPATPQSDATDEAAVPAGRQLRTDGSCTVGVNPWTWAS